jgi:hypothetical protein
VIPPTCTYTTTTNNNTNANPSNLSLPELQPGMRILFVITLHHARCTLSRSAWPAIQLELDARLGRLRRSDAGHGASGSTVGSRSGVVKVLPFREVGSFLAEFGDESVLWSWSVSYHS